MDQKPLMICIKICLGNEMPDKPMDEKKMPLMEMKKKPEGMFGMVADDIQIEDKSPNKEDKKEEEPAEDDD